MGLCKFCDQKAGLFRSIHKECQFANDAGKMALIRKVCDTITSTSSLTNFDSEISSIAQSSYIKDYEIAELCRQGFDNAVETFLEDGVISHDEEQKLANFKNHVKLPDNVLDKAGALQKVVKSLILRDIIEGKTPSRLNISEDLPFLLQKGESIIWIFHNVEFYEQRTKTIYEGKSSGVSVRIAKGLYYRTGSFKGNPVKSEQMVSMGIGMMALSTKSIYFGSPSKAIKIPYNKLIAITPYTDGIGIQKDGTSAKPQIFKGIDGWFTYNLISNLNQT